MKFSVLFLNGTKSGNSCYFTKGAPLPPLVILRKSKVDQKINSKAFIFYLMFLLVGVCFGFVLGNYQRPETNTEIAAINYDSVCLRTLKEYYINQNPKERKKMIDQASKQLAIDNMTKN
jgi:hypothetical protein